MRPGESVVLLMAAAAACSSPRGGAAGAAGAGGAGATGGATSVGGSASTSDGGAGGAGATGGATSVGGSPATPDGAAGQPSSSGGTGGSGHGDGAAGEARPPDAGASLRFAVPLYIWPGEGDAWAQVAAAGSEVSYIVANAGDPGGPGPSSDRAYTSAIAAAHTAGQRVLGYVDTSFASRALAAVLADVDRWYSFYPQIDGIFLDQTPADAAGIASYFKPVSDHIRAESGAHIVIINPGQPDFAEGYMAVADVAMSYENPYGSASNGYGSGHYVPAAWMSHYPAERFWHVILEVPEGATMHQVLDLARARNVGHVYVTNYADPPAYAHLPAYFADEMAALAH